MPSENLVKDYIKGAYYHIYNRGVAKQDTFLEDFDYNYFLYKIRMYLTDMRKKEKDHRHNIKLVSFCLMPNHYHLLVQNISERGIERFMRSLCTCYSMYFNRKYNRIGPVFQDRYKAKLIKTEAQLLTTSLYIHKNPEEAPEPLERYAYSSLKYYVSNSGGSWINPQTILSYLSLDKGKSIEMYKNFIGGSST